VPDPTPRWLDREALAAHISVRVDELPRLADLRAALPAYADLAGDALADQIMASMRAEIARLETA